MAKKIVDETLKFNILINGTAAKKEYGQLERENRKLLNANKDLEQQAKKMEKSNQQNTEGYRKLKKEIADNSKKVKEHEHRMSELSNEIGINNLTMRELGQEARKLSGILSNLDPNTEDWKKYNVQLQAVKGRMANLREEMKPIEESMDEQIDLASTLGVAFTSLFASLAAGDVKGATAALTTIQNGLKGATAAAWKFIATPVGAAIAVLAAAGAGLKFWANYNENVKEAVLLTQQITGLMGEESDAVRRQAKVLEEVYGADFKETLGTANGIVREFGGTFEEALDEIEKGLQKGQINNNEYFDSLQEYDTFFASAGFAVNEFRKVIETGYDLGIYSDKLPDAIKEADLAIREQTPATRDALVNAFGAAFTDDLLKRVKKGKTTTKEALQEISAEADKNSINIQQNAQLTADLFKGAGEDAGGALKIFDALNTALNETERALTPLESMVKDLADAELELAEAQDKALKSDRYVALSNDIELFWVRTKTAFFKGVDFIVDNFTKFDNFMVKFWVQNITTFQSFPTIVSSAFQKVKKEVFDVVKTFGGLGDVIKNLLNFNFSAASDSFAKFKDDFKKEVGDVVGVHNNAIKQVIAIRKKVGDKVDSEFANKRAAAAAQSALPKKDPDLLDDDPDLPDGPDSDKQKRIDEIKQREKEITDFIKAETDKRIIAAKQGLEKELAIIDQKYASQLAKASENAVLTGELLALKAQEQNDAKVRYAGELAERLRILDEENFLAAEELRLEREIAEAETQAEKDLLNLEREQLIAQQKLDSELFLAEERLRINNATEEEIFAVRNKFGLAAQKLELKFFNAKKKITSDEKEDKKDKIRSEVSEAAKATGQLAELLGKQTAAGKAANIAQATMNTYQGVTEVWRAQSVLPEPAATIAKVLSTATVLASGLSAVGAIKKQDTSVPGFEQGKYDVTRQQDGKKFSANFGGTANTQIVGAPTTFLAGEMPEMIIDPDTFKKMDPSVTDYILGLAGKGVQGFEEGLYNDVAKPDLTSEMTLDVLLQLRERLDAPIMAEMYYGAEASRKQQEYDQKIKDTRTNAKIKA